MKETIQTLEIKDNGVFPNSHLPVLVYKQVLDLPFLLPSLHLKKLFADNNWGNAWDSGIFEYQHYHSITHEVLGVYGGATIIQLGGETGPHVKLEKNDVIIIPAGVAHINLMDEAAIQCMGAYPNGMDYDMNYGKPGERPVTDINISKVPIPDTDPVFGTKGGIIKLWV